MASEVVHSPVPFDESDSVSVDMAERVAPIERRHATQILLLAIWFGLLTGFIEGFVFIFKRFYWHQIVEVSRHIAWLAPLANALFFAIPGIILFLIAHRWPKLVSLRVATVLFAFLCFLSLLFLYPVISHFAAVPLALGLAVQTVLLVTKRAPRFHSLVRRTTLWMAAIVIGLAVGMYGWHYLAERRALAKLPAAVPGAPNVLLITLDTVRAQSLSLYGNRRPTTPQLELLSRKGVRFDLALATAPWTLPSHASMFTGRFDHELVVEWWKEFDSTYPTLAEVLTQHGYRTAGFVANDIYCTFESGLDRGFTHYEDFKISPAEMILSSALSRAVVNSYHVRGLIGYHELIGRKTATQLNRDFLDWLSRQQDERPFFAFLNYFDAHEPYLPPKPFDNKFGPNTQRKHHLLRYSMREGSRAEKEGMSPLEIQGELDAYEASIAYMDHELGLLFDELEKRGLLENTLVIVTSDHGELFGEHGVFDHANSVYLPALQVPLLISFPTRVPAGKTVDQPVSLRDIPATVFDLTNLNDARFPGASLARFWEAGRIPDTPATPVLSELKRNPDLPAGSPASEGDSKSLVADGYHYIKRGDGVEELYDIEKDPLETKDLVRSEDSQQVLGRFRSSLKTFVR